MPASTAAALGEDRYQSIERRGGEVIGRALDWLTTHRDGPFFIWIHLYDAHDPYDPPEPYKTRYASAPYDGEIAYVDAAVGKFLSWLRLRGLYDGALIAVMADHGEALGEHGEATHGIFLYDETIHVPLLFKLPRGRSAGTRIDTRAGPGRCSSDHACTPSGIASPAARCRANLCCPLLKPASVTTGNDTQASETSPIAQPMPRATIRTALLAGVRCARCAPGKYLFIEAPRKELYDQSADPKEEHNLAHGIDGCRQHISRPARCVSAEDEHHERSAESGARSRTSGKAERPGIRRDRQHFVEHAWNQGHGRRPQR